MRNLLIKIISTFFFVGYLPFMPGTFGSIAGVFVALIVKDSLMVYILVTLLLAFLGFRVGLDAEKVFHCKDPKYVVIDEVVGMLLALMFLPYYNFWVIIIAFILFRAFDIIKPYPANSLQKLKVGSGIMLDDIIAGLYTNIILQVVIRQFSLRIS